ncbi:MAG: hypothetical protein GY782_08160 [Gammaproteobacteria bacterium]|nr:hypothetical protein [Gammaproteobacteria bacterium]
MESMGGYHWNEWANKTEYAITKFLQNKGFSDLAWSHQNQWFALGILFPCDELFYY